MSGDLGIEPISFAVLVPALDCATTIAEVVSGARREIERVVVVDDGSSDDTAARAAAAGAEVLRHPRNLGKAAALRSGFERLASAGVTHVVTMDGDGQHLSGELPALLAASRRHPLALVIGARRREQHAIAPAKRFGNDFANRWVEIACGVALPDTQSGFRVYPLAAVRALAARSERFAWETEVLIRAARAGIPIESVAVDAHYPPPEVRSSHYRPFVDTVRIIRVVVGTILEPRARLARLGRLGRLGPRGRRSPPHRQAAARRDAGALLLLCAALGAFLAGCGGGRDAAAPRGENPIVAENRRAGSDRWQWETAGLRLADDVARQIKGYASATSVAPGDRLELHVSVDPPQPFTVEIYRLGWYGGAGGRLVERLGPLDGRRQPECPVDARTGRIACAWSPGPELVVPRSWPSGIYLALLANQAGFANHVVFVVRDDERPAALLFQQSVTTYQAYNRYPNDGVTGKSLYGDSHGPLTGSGGKRAVEVSFDRPYQDGGAGQLFEQEIHFVRWLERSGFDVTYSTNLDTHRHGERLREHPAFLSVGHDEYWSREMFDAVVAARDAGVHLGFFGANDAHWQIRLADGSGGRPLRTMICFKDAALDPAQGPLATVRWRDPPVSRPEQTLIGIQYTDVIEGGVTGALAPYVVQGSDHWIYRGTGLRDGDAIAGLVGYETDRLQPELPRAPSLPGSFQLLSHSPIVNFAGQPAYANSSIYQAPGGAWVFAAGTIAWSRGLDDLGEHQAADPRIQTITANVLDRFTGR